MKIGFYIASFFAALILALTILIVLELNYDRQHNVFAIGLSMAVLLVHTALLIIYPFIRSDFLTKLIKSIGWVSMVAILLLALTCYPNRQVRRAFTTIGSQLTSENTHEH
jgi:hypothetical protein